MRPSSPTVSRRRVADRERLVARRERRAAVAPHHPPPKRSSPHRVEVRGVGQRRARGARALAHERERPRARHADVPQIGAARRTEREVLRMGGEELARQELDEGVAAALDREVAAAELGRELGDVPLRVVRVADEEEPRRARLRHPVDERDVRRQARGEAIGHRVVPRREIRGPRASGERRRPSNARTRRRARPGPGSPRVRRATSGTRPPRAARRPRPGARAAGADEHRAALARAPRARCRRRARAPVRPLRARATRPRWTRRRPASGSRPKSRPRYAASSSAANADRRPRVRRDDEPRASAAAQVERHAGGPGARARARRSTRDTRAIWRPAGRGTVSRWARA
jgi:hypothetical protein